MSHKYRQGKILIGEKSITKEQITDNVIAIRLL